MTSHARRILLPALALALVAPAVLLPDTRPVAAQDDEILEAALVLRLEERDRMVLDLTHVQSTETKGDFRLQGEVTQRRVLEMRVEEVDDDGVMTIQAVYARLVFHRDANGDDFHVDTGDARSRKSNKDNVNAVPWLLAHGQGFTFKVNGSGEILDVEGHDELEDAIDERQDELREDDPGGGGGPPFLGGGGDLNLDNPFTDDHAAEWLAVVFGQIPATNLMVGSGWRAEGAMNPVSGFGGRAARMMRLEDARYQDRFTLVGVGEKRGRVLAEVEQRSIFTKEDAEKDDEEQGEGGDGDGDDGGEGDEEPPAFLAGTDVKEGSGKGTMVFDADRGLLLEWKCDREAVVENEFRGTTYESELTEEWKLEVQVR